MYIYHNRYMLNNKEPFLFFASIPPYTKSVNIISENSFY